jgi:hypothetical protein
MFNRFNLSNFSSSGGDTSSADTANHEGTSTKSNTCVATKIDADKLLEMLKVKPPPFHPEERLLVIESWEAVEQHIAQVAQQLSKSIIIILIIILIIKILLIIKKLIIILIILLQWVSLNGITLGPRQTDPINRLIPLTDKYIGINSKQALNIIIKMIPLAK